MEYLFRGKRLDNGQLIEGGISEFNGSTDMFDSNSMCNNCYEVDEISTCQFTGMKDLFDQNIFGNSDKFKFEFTVDRENKHELIGSFDYNEDELRWEIDIYNNDKFTCLSYNPTTMSNFIIIGNIYEK